MKNSKSKNWTLFDPSSTDDDLIAAAMAVLEKRIKYNAVQLSSPEDTKNFLRLKFTGLEHEVFAILFLDNRHRVIEYEELFRGTILSVRSGPAFSTRRPRSSPADTSTAESAG